MRPIGLKTRIFLDSGDPQETREALAMLGFLDGQTTNPSLIAKNPDAVGKSANWRTAAEVNNFYEKVVKEVSDLIPEGSVSIEVYADINTKAEEMLKQAGEFYTWIPNAHIKFPTTFEGLKAAENWAKQGKRVNMTLVFSQEQAAAVYSASQGASRGQVYLSPFVGRLDDRGENGLGLIANIARMYKQGDGHVEILSASIRNLDHFLGSIALGADILTVPFKVLKDWTDAGMPITSSQLAAVNSQLKPIPYQQIGLNKSWQDYNIHHELTDKGIEKFAADWNNLIK